MANRVFRKIMQKKRAMMEHAMSEYIPQHDPEEVSYVKVQTTQPAPVWNPEKEILDNLRSVWYNFKNAEDEVERNEYLKTIDKILSK